jgi:hypothetical protein
MNIFASKWLGFVALGFSLLALLSLHGCKTTSTPTADESKTVPPIKTAPHGDLGEVMEVRVEDYRAHKDEVVNVSARKQQSVLWLCNCKFRILSVKADMRYAANPKDLPRRFPSGPFYRGFPDKNDAAWRAEFFNAVSSGPVMPLAAPRKGYYQFKATIQIEGGETIDPHIMTAQGIAAAD